MLGAQPPQQGNGLIDDMNVKGGAKLAAIGIQCQFCMVDFNAVCRCDAKANAVMGRSVGGKINDRFQQEVKMLARWRVLENQRDFNRILSARIGDFRFVVLERFLSFENQLSLVEGMIMKAYFFIKDFTPSEDKWFGLDTSAVKIEKVPLIIRPVENVKLRRIE